MHVQLDSDASSFTFTVGDLVLGPNGSQAVDVVFAPDRGGHQSAVLTITTDTSRPEVRLLAHGFGGNAPDTGPTLAAEPLFFSDIGTTFGILPDGARFFADNGLHSCMAPTNTGTLDLCAVDTDCDTKGESCALSSKCVAGPAQGQMCMVPDDCPGGDCRSYNAVDPIDMCGDGSGGLYLVTDFGTYTDPSPGNTELDASLVHLQFDPATGARTAFEIVDRVTDGTTQIACDGVAAGNVYLAEFFNVTSPSTDCSREEREQLTAFPKDGRRSKSLVRDMAEAGGFAECDDFEEASDLEVARDGSAAYASWVTSGLYRIHPTPLAISPDITDYFQVHPDGSIVYVIASDAGTTGQLSVYRISPAQAAAGPVSLPSLAPCAVYQVPNNRLADRGSTVIGTNSFAVGRAAPGSADGIVLVSFLTTGGFPELSQTLLTRGTVAIRAPAGSGTCSVLGLVTLDFFDPMTF
jgi:hypothetical protein